VRRGRILLYLLLFQALVIVACGKKSLPVPPGVGIPARATDLTSWGKDEGIVLSWKVPTQNIDGSRLEDLIGFVVFRRERPLPFSPCTECPDKFEPVAEIDVEYPRGAEIRDGKVLWRDRDLKPGNEYTYFVVAYNAEKVPSVESVPLRRIWGVSPAAPREVRVESLDRALRLSWQIIPRLVDGQEITEGPFLLKTGDLKDSAALSKKLGEGRDPVSKYLQKYIQPDTWRLMEEYNLYDESNFTSRQLVEDLTDALNQAIQGPSLYETERFAGVLLPAWVRKWAGEEPQGENLRHLNRILLEAVYPAEISKYRAHLAGFNVYRRGEKEPLEFAPLNSEPIVENQFLDGGLENGKKYFYQVHALRNYWGSLIEGPGSKEVEGISEKTKPPIPPAGLTANVHSQGVELHWDRNPEPDVAGYNLYRKQKGEDRFQKVNAQLIPENYYLDRSADPQKSYAYRVTAVDSSPAARESDFPRDVEISPSPIK
jgi:hypothetical protein